MLFLEVNKNDKVEIQNEFGKRCPIKLKAQLSIKSKWNFWKARELGSSVCVVLGKNLVYKDLAMGETGVYKQHIMDTGANTKAKCCEGGSEAKVV